MKGELLALTEFLVIFDSAIYYIVFFAHSFQAFYPVENQVQVSPGDVLVSFFSHTCIVGTEVLCHLFTPCLVCIQLNYHSVLVVSLYDLILDWASFMDNLSLASVSQSDKFRLE